MVTVVMSCYNPEPEAPRMVYAARSLVALHKNLHGPFSTKVKYLLADDGSPHLLPLQDFAQIWPDTSYITGPHGGIGTSLNRAMHVLYDEPWVYTTDDWVLTDPLDLTLPLHLLDIGYDLVRLGPIHPNVRCTTNFEYPWGWWLDLDVYSNQYSCATRPFLASPRLMQKIGPWTEGADSYQTEIDFGHACQMYEVSAAAINLAGPWEHIGEYAVGNWPVTTALPIGKGDTGA